MKNIKKITVLTLALIMTLASVLTAEPRSRGRRNFDDCPRGDGPPRRERDHHHGRYMFFGNLERMQKELNLSDKQITAISDINIAYKKKHLDLKEKLTPKRIKLQKLLIEEKVDLNAVKKTLNELSKIQAEKRFLMIKHHLDIEKVLTEKQRKLLRARRPQGRLSFNQDKFNQKRMPLVW